MNAIVPSVADEVMRVYLILSIMDLSLTEPHPGIEPRTFHYERNVFPLQPMRQAVDYSLHQALRRRDFLLTTLSIHRTESTVNTNALI